jgi:hypothetical protein
MIDGDWHTLFEISDLTLAPAQSVSARLRDFRKTRYGAHIVDRRYVANGVWEYKLTQRGNEGPQDRETTFWQGYK